MLSARSGRPTPADGRDAERDAQLDRPAGPRHRRVPRARPAVAAPSAVHAPSCPSRAAPSTSTPSSRSGCATSTASPRSRSTSRCPNVESRGQVFACDPSAAAAVIAAVRRNSAPGGAGARQALPRRHRHRRGRPRRRERGRRRPLADQHAARHGHRRRHHAARARRRHRGAVRPGDPAGRRALRVPGARGPARRADPRHGRDPAPDATRWSSSSPAPRPCRVGTAIFNDPSAVARVSSELAQALADRGFDRLRDAVGYAHREPDPRPAAGGPVGADDVDGPGDAARVEESIAAGVEG